MPVGGKLGFLLATILLGDRGGILLLAELFQALEFLGSIPATYNIFNGQLQHNNNWFGACALEKTNWTEEN